MGILDQSTISKPHRRQRPWLSGLPQGPLSLHTPVLASLLLPLIRLPIENSSENNNHWQYYMGIVLVCVHFMV